MERIDRGYAIIWLDSDGAYWLADAKNPLKENEAGVMKFHGKKIKK